MLCMQQTDLCMHRLTAGFKPQGKKRKMLFSKKQAQKISSVMDQDLHECVLSRQSRVATCSIWRICCLANFQMKTFHMHLKEKNCNSKFGPKYIFLNCGAAGEKKKSINTYTRFTIIKLISIIPTMNWKWTTLQNSLGYIFYQWMVLFTFFKKIRSGRLHGATLIHLIFFCLFPTKHFHRGKTMMSSSSSLSAETVWLQGFLLIYGLENFSDIANKSR